MKVAYLQGGPADLQKHAIAESFPNIIRIAQLVEASRLIDTNVPPEVSTVTHEYAVVGGYRSHDGVDIATYGWKGQV